MKNDIIIVKKYIGNNINNMNMQCNNNNNNKIMKMM